MSGNVFKEATEELNARVVELANLLAAEAETRGVAASCRLDGPSDEAGLKQAYYVHFFQRDSKWCFGFSRAANGDPGEIKYASLGVRIHFCFHAKVVIEWYRLYSAWLIEELREAARAGADHAKMIRAPNDSGRATK